MLGAEKQKAWLTDQAFLKERGFETVDTTENGYALLALSFDGTKPHFTENAKTMRIDEQGLVVHYDPQCPYAAQSIAQIVATEQANAKKPATQAEWSAMGTALGAALAAYNKAP